jgi:PPM family protein phosphatase
MNLLGVLGWADTTGNERSSTLRKYIPEIESGGLSIVGPVRENNQDSIHLPDHEQPAGLGLLFAIADGMGGYTHGGVASLLALESFSSTLTTQNGTPIPKALQRSVENANLQVYQKAQQLGAGRMGTTLTAAYVLGDILYLAHVGDSRAYLIRDGRATCLTADHTAVGDMVRAKILSPDKIRTHAQRSVLTKAIGIGLFVQADIIQHRLHEGDRLVLCSDGVWSVIEDDEFARVVREQAPVDLISRNLIDLALQHKTDDNASTVVFHLRKLLAAPEDHSSHQENNWFKKLRKLVP